MKRQLQTKLLKLLDCSETFRRAVRESGDIFSERDWPILIVKYGADLEKRLQGLELLSVSAGERSVVKWAAACAAYLRRKAAELSRPEPDAVFTVSVSEYETYCAPTLAAALDIVRLYHTYYKKYVYTCKCGHGCMETSEYE